MKLYELRKIKIGIKILKKLKAKVLDPEKLK